MNLRSNLDIVAAFVLAVTFLGIANFELRSLNDSLSSRADIISSSGDTVTRFLVHDSRCIGQIQIQILRDREVATLSIRGSASLSSSSSKATIPVTLTGEVTFNPLKQLNNGSAQIELGDRQITLNLSQPNPIRASIIYQPTVTENNSNGGKWSIDLPGPIILDTNSPSGFLIYAPSVNLGRISPVLALAHSTINSLGVSISEKLEINCGDQMGSIDLDSITSRFSNSLNGALL